MKKFTIMVPVICEADNEHTARCLAWALKELSGECAGFTAHGTYSYRVRGKKLLVSDVMREFKRINHDRPRRK